MSSRCCSGREYFQEFEKEPNKNWLKGVVAFLCLRKQLERFIDEEIRIFHRELVDKCGADLCVKNCSFHTWKPQQNQSPPLCDVCSFWRDLILNNHTSPGGKVMWKNSKPDRWSQDKWEVAKVYMPGGHTNHNSIGEFDIAALLCLMKQCKHFKKFKIHGSCDNVSSVRNNIMHSPSFQLKQKDFLDCFNQIRKLGKVLEKHHPEFKSLSKDIDEIKNLDCRLTFPDDMAARKIQAQDETELEDILFDLTAHANAFVINVRAKHRLSQKYMNDIAAVQQYQSSLLDNLRKQMEGVLKKHSGSTSVQLKKDAMGIFDNFSDPFASVATTIRQNSVLKKQFSCSDAEEIPSARTIFRKKRGGSKVFNYVPLVKSREQFLSHPSILSMIEKGPQRCREGLFHDIVDGALRKSHPLFLEKPLQIVLYMDEMESCNPLGSFAPNNMLLMVYYKQGNINPKYMDALYSGVKMQTINGEKAIYGAMVSLCGNPLCSFEDMQSHFNEDAYTKRTLEKHVRQCDKMEKANTDLLGNSLRTTYGINRRSKLVEFPAFDIIQQTLQDIMHVILEGIAPLEIKCVFNHLVQSVQIALDSVNSAILGFPFSPLDVRDRPSPISVTTLMSSDGKLKQSSGQMLVLLRILPFVLESLEANAYVQLIIELIEIVQIVFAPVLTTATVSRLKLLIENHLKLWKELFPDRSVTPKQHYMIYICKCLINQNQIYESCQNVDPSMHPIFLNEREMGPVSEVKDLQYLRGKLRDFLGINEVNHAVVKWLVINGITYITQKSMILAKVLNGNMPEFGLVKNIFLVDSRLYCLEYQPFQTICFDRNVMAYQVEVPHLAQATELVDAEKLVDFLLNNQQQEPNFLS